jgi:hypothetical protein
MIEMEDIEISEYLRTTGNVILTDSRVKTLACSSITNLMRTLNEDRATSVFYEIPDRTTGQIDREHPLVKITTFFGDNYIRVGMLRSALDHQGEWQFMTFDDTGVMSHPLMSLSASRGRYVSALHGQAGSQRKISTIITYKIDDQTPERIETQRPQTRQERQGGERVSSSRQRAQEQEQEQHQRDLEIERRRVQRVQPRQAGQPRQAVQPRESEELRQWRERQDARPVQNAQQLQQQQQLQQARQRQQAQQIRQLTERRQAHEFIRQRQLADWNANTAERLASQGAGQFVPTWIILRTPDILGVEPDYNLTGTIRDYMTEHYGADYAYPDSNDRRPLYNIHHGTDEDHHDFILITTSPERFNTIFTELSRTPLIFDGHTFTVERLKFYPQSGDIRQNYIALYPSSYMGEDELEEKKDRVESWLHIINVEYIDILSDVDVNGRGYYNILVEPDMNERLLRDPVNVSASNGKVILIPTKSHILT